MGPLGSQTKDLSLATGVAQGHVSEGRTETCSHRLRESATVGRREGAGEGRGGRRMLKGGGGI